MAHLPSPEKVLVPVGMQSANEKELDRQMKMTAWDFNLPPEELIDEPLQLLTLMGISVCGYWTGLVGENFVGWSTELIHPTYAN